MSLEALSYALIRSLTIYDRLDPLNCVCQREVTVDETTSKAIEVEIGARVRHIRQQRNITLKQLSEQIGLTKGQLSKIENGKVSSPASTLARVANAMGVSVGDFFGSNDNAQRAIFVSSTERPVVIGRASKMGHIYQSLAMGSMRKAFEPYLMIIEDENLDPSLNVFRHDSHEFLYMLRGSMDYRHGNRIYKLEEGDSLFFDASIEHGPVRVYQKRVEFICVISNSGSGDKS